MQLLQWFKRILKPVAGKSPAEAYNLWAGSYDNQPDNLILRLDEEIFGSYLHEIDLSGKAIADIGCGTGRHWEKIFLKKPGRLAGFDVSQGMLDQLKKKYPHAETYLLKEIQSTGNSSPLFDLIISTLTIAHIKDIYAALQGWDNVLKPGGEVIITDYHPEALKRNAKRTFKHGGKTIAVESHIHPVAVIRAAAKQLGWAEVRFTERVTDERVKPFYDKQNATDLYEQFLNMPLIYGIHLIKGNAAV